jgi:SAM-dependent methyltransferase
MTFANTDQAQFWSEMAPTWVEMEDNLAEVAGPPGELAMERLGLKGGERVVDLGCGTGETSLALAAQVGEEGSVVGVDIAPEMLARAAEHAKSRSVANVEFVNADVQSTDLGTGVFDAAFSRFGVMFFSDPKAAFTNVKRSLRGGGRLSFVCWQTVFDNEWMLIPGMAVAAVTGQVPPMPEPGAPGPFSLSDPEHVRSILVSSGFGDVEILPHNDRLARPADAIPQLALISSRVGAVREALKEADDATRAKAMAAVEQALRDHVEEGELRVSRGVLVVTASA